MSLVLEDDLPRVYIDKIQVQLVLFNLVRNAMEALERSPTREIEIKTLRSKDGAVEVQVWDTGPGVDPRMVDQLFTEYFSTKEHGMGVGLSISQSIVDAHGGRLWATNTSGGGATFILLFQSSNQSMASNCKVLIVDDDKGVRASLAALLRTAVFEVETYGSGPEFLQLGLLSAGDAC